MVDSRAGNTTNLEYFVSKWNAQDLMGMVEKTSKPVQHNIYGMNYICKNVNIK
jgi:hypothetical protein